MSNKTSRINKIKSAEENTVKTFENIDDVKSAAMNKLRQFGYEIYDDEGVIMVIVDRKDGIDGIRKTNTDVYRILQESGYHRSYGVRLS